MSDKTEPKPPVVAGRGMAAIVPQDIEQAFRLSQALARGGDMVPRHFQNQPEQIMAAVMRGMEIGLAPMQALSNIAVINGRASVWGDALPALMQKAGHHLDVEITGEGDDMKAVATLTRGDTGKTITREFSVNDAKRANLWGKQGPWTTYPKRMLMMRARAWAVRDGASDAMMGLQVAEEMQDAPPMKDVTPKSDGFAAMAQKARQRDDTVTVEPEDVPQDPPHWTSSVDTSAADPMSDQWEEGAAAQDEGQPREACPYDADEAAAANWLGAWDQAGRAKE